MTEPNPWIFSWATQLAVAAAVPLTAWTLGRGVLKLLWPAGLILGFAPYTALGLGLGALATVVFVLGSAGLLGGSSLTLLLAAGVLVALIDCAARFRDWIASDVRSQVPEKMILSLPLIAGLLYATLPPVFYDALVYHLGLPNLYLATGSLAYPEAFSLAGYPQNTEMILTLALAAGGEVAARLTGFLLSALAALALRRIVVDRFGRVAGNLAYLLLVSQWFFWFQAIFLKVDMIGAFFLLAGFAAILDGEETDGYRPWIVGGVLLGLAVGVKFSNLAPVGLAAISLPWVVRSKVRVRWRHGLLVLLLAVGVASPWLLRNTAHRGNPFFPAFYESLGGTGWDADNAARMRAETGMNLDRSPIASVKRLAAIGWRSGYGSGGELSRVWIPLLLSGLLFSRRRDATWMLGLAAASLAIGVVFFTSYLRVYAPALVLVPIAGAVLWERFRLPLVRVVLGLVFAAIAVPGFIFSFNMCESISGEGSRVLLGKTTPEDYLVERLSYTPVARYINENLDSSARIRIIGSARSAYINRECAFTYVWDDPWIAPLIDDPAAVDRLTAELRDQGFTHVLLDTGEMDRLERAQGLYGYLSRDGGRDGIDAFLGGLKMEVEANGVYLFSVPAPS